MNGMMLKRHMLSLDWFSDGKHRDRIQEAQRGALAGGRKPWERMDAQGVELELPRYASTAFLTRPGGGSEGVRAFFLFFWTGRNK